MGTVYFKVMAFAHSDDKFLTGEHADNFLNMIVQSNSPGSSNWFKSLRLFVNSEAKTMLEYVQYYKAKYLRGEIKREDYEQISAQGASSLTVRQCPGIKELMTRSITIKAPCDIIIQFGNKALMEGKGDFQTLIADEGMVNIQSHHPSQWHSSISKHNIMKNKVNVKFLFPIQMYTDKAKPWVYTNPAYHTNSPFEVLPGGIFGDYTKGQGLIINTVYNINENEDETIIKINQGDPIAYMVFPEKMKVKRTEKVLHGIFRPKFGRSVKII